MRYQIDTVRTVVSKADDACEARTAALNQRDRDLSSAAGMGWTLTSTVVLDGTDVATFVDTITYTPPTE